MGGDEREISNYILLVSSIFFVKDVTIKGFEFHAITVFKLLIL